MFFVNLGIVNGCKATNYCECVDRYRDKVMGVFSYILHSVYNILISMLRMD